MTADTIIKDLRARFAAANIQEAYVDAFGTPPVDGLGTLGGFKLQVEDRANLGYLALQRATLDLAAAATKEPGHRVSRALSSRSRFPTPRASSPNATFDSTFMCGKSA